MTREKSRPRYELLFWSGAVISANTASRSDLIFTIRNIVRGVDRVTTCIILITLLAFAALAMIGHMLAIQSMPAIERQAGSQSADQKPIQSSLSGVETNE